MNTELEELAMEYERTHAAACITEKRGKNFEYVKRDRNSENNFKGIY